MRALTLPVAIGVTSATGASLTKGSVPRDHWGPGGMHTWTGQG
jgi:hypothetical protein